MLPRMLSMRAAASASSKPISTSRRLPCLCPRRSLTTTSSLSKPAAQLAQPEADNEPYYHHSPSISRHTDPQPLVSPLASYPYRPSTLLQLPQPLPADVIPDASAPQSTLYPTTGVLDAISLISICLRRPEHTPRAYEIFKQLLEETKTGVKRMPEAEVWGKMIQGTAALCKRDPKDPDLMLRWQDRTQLLIDTWESYYRKKGLHVVAGAEKGGLKIYQGWFAGLISSGSFINPLKPYFLNRAFSVAEILKAIPETQLPIAYEALSILAKRDPDLDWVETEIGEQKGIKEAKIEQISRDVIPEVKPVMEGERRNILRREPTEEINSPEASLQASARFAVRNLRSTLEKLQDVKLPQVRQMELEQASYEAARLELAHSYEQIAAAKSLANVHEDTILQRQRLQGWMYEWLGELKDRLQVDINTLQTNFDEVSDDKFATSLLGNQTSVAKDDALVLHLSLLPVDKLAVITVIEMMRQTGGHGVADGMKALRAMIAVGKAVETEYRAETIRNVAGADSPHWLRALDPQSQKPTPALVGSVWRNLGRQLEGKQPMSPLDKTTEEDLRTVWTPPWTQMAHLGVGAFLVQRLLDTAKVERSAYDPETGEQITERQAAFSHGYDYVRGKKLGVIRLNPVVAKRLSKDNLGTMIHPKHLPMLVEPRPWRKYDDGGYLIHKVPVMRFKDSSEQRSYLQAASDEGHLEPVFHGLDVLSSTPWTINRRVFDVILQAWNSGEAIADIPASEEKSNYELPQKSETGDPAARAAYVEKAKQALAQSRKDHGERCKFNYNIEIARSYLHETFYLPHSMDFRGRAYPIPPHLSPVGDDLCRGLLTFGVKRPLGKTGLKWLQIHLANVYGFDKASFEDRARFAQDHEADIFDSADRPLEGDKWWLKAEDPWQCLATCMEIASALRSPDPELFESSLPVHQDGTCNGMQHYAALGGDVRGARAVNLENGDRPADIYTGVADVVNKVIAQDKEAGHPMAMLIPGALGRKVVKQTVMTTVYGVTFIGARDQIARQLIARGDIPLDQIFMISSYIAKTVLSCIGDLFSGAKDIMDWLSTSARLIARSIPPERVSEAVKQIKPVRSKKSPKGRLERELMTSVIWTTPLGLPVVQPYRKPTKKQVMTALQSVYIADPNAPSEVSPQKQATAFPPNFIHSLDATHMLLTAQRCKQKSITFSSVHDSYWTHAATVEPMSEMIRDMFIQLHEGDLIGELRNEFIERYGDYRIAVKSAKDISTSAARKREKDAERRKAMASLLGEEPGSAVVDAAVEGADVSVEKTMEAQGAIEEGGLGSDDAGLFGGALPDASSDVDEAELGIGGEDSVSSTTTTAKKQTVGPTTSLELSNADLALLKKKRDDTDVPEEIISDQRFVKFKDVIPPCPPRGAFDVTRIKDSAYFFS